MEPTLLVFGGGFVAALVLTPLAMRVAVRTGMVDRPDRRLKRHAAPVPYLGGVAIFLACALAIVAGKLGITGTMRGVVGILAGGTAVFLLGLWDDARPLSPRAKLAFQIAAAFIPVYFGVHIKFIENPWGALPLTILWIVGVTNALNLLDIMDGLCGGVAVVAAVSFWIISGQHDRINDAIIAAALVGAVLGFLWYNRAPARIFMGDAGSMFIGFILATVAIGEGYSVNTNFGVVAPILILGVPIFETLFVMAVRWQQGKPLLQGSPDHVPLRMVRLGYSPPRVVAILCGAGAILSVLAHLVVHMNWERSVLIGVAVSVAAVMFAIKLASVNMARR